MLQFQLQDTYSSHTFRETPNATAMLIQSLLCAQVVPLLDRGYTSAYTPLTPKALLV